MQSYSQNAEKGNIFSQLRAWRAQQSEGMTNAKVNKIVSLRNDNTHADESLIMIRIVLYVVTAFTAYCGFLFYQDTFGKVFSPTATLVSALALAGVTELLKIWLTHRALRALFFGWIFKNFWALGGWLFIGALGLGAFWWSVNISTDGMNMMTREMTENNTPKSDYSAVISAATADVDRQIEALTKGQHEAMGTKWKGTTTRDAQKIAGTTALSIQSLQEQRAAIVAQTTADHQAQNSVRATNISNWAFWIQRYGGYMEAVAFMSIMAMVFFERRLVHLHQNTPTAPHPGTRRTEAPPAQNFNLSAPNPAFSNFAPGHPADNSVRPLSGLSDKTKDADDFIKYRLKRLRGWDDNFNHPRNKPETVAQNMCTILNEIGKKMIGEGFDPTPETMLDLIEYVTTEGFPAMENAGYEYKSKADFLEYAQRYAGQSMRA